jgi:uncharacterized protein with ATP-grasp and redox domains
MSGAGPATAPEYSPNAPPAPACRGTDGPDNGFAFPTLAKRMPVIITKVIDAICRIYMAKDFEGNPANGGKTAKDAKQIVNDIGALRYELQHDRKLVHIRDDGDADVAVWNRMLDAYFPDATWFNATWLFVECYMYRRIREAIQRAPSWRGFDPFTESKTSAFKDAAKGVADLALRFGESAPKDLKPEAARLLFHELVQVCLWGNATDLSLLPHLSAEQAEELQSRASSKMADSEKNILQNDIDATWTHVSKVDGARCDIVLDNAGFELYSDLLLADHLHASGKISKTVFHAKTIPWFVSDTTIADFHLAFEQLSDPSFFSLEAGAQEAVDKMLARWKGYLDSGAWQVKEHGFWCSAWSFWHLKEEAPELFAELKSSDLVIFKGDLNCGFEACAVPGSLSLTLDSKQIANCCTTRIGLRRRLSLLP